MPVNGIGQSRKLSPAYAGPTAHSQSLAGLSLLAGGNTADGIVGVDARPGTTAPGMAAVIPGTQACLATVGLGSPARRSRQQLCLESVLLARSSRHCQVEVPVNRIC